MPPLKSKKSPQRRTKFYKARILLRLCGDNISNTAFMKQPAPLKPASLVLNLARSLLCELRVFVVLYFRLIRFGMRLIRLLTQLF